MHADPIAAQQQKVRGLAAIVKLRDVLGKYTFAGNNEEQVQRQLLLSLGMAKAYGEDAIEVLGSEVINDRGRWDVLVAVKTEDGVARVVIELKVRGTAGAAEAQAQRYAGDPNVDAVVVATSSSRLAHSIATGAGQAIVHQTLGGKAFGILYLRPF